MIRLFNVYYPTRTLVLLICEVLLVGGSFLLATACLLVPDGYVVLINELVYENGLLKIAGITALTLLLTYYFDLYGPRRTSATVSYTHLDVYKRQGSPGQCRQALQTLFPNAQTH